MCIYTDGTQLPSHAICSCGAKFPKCDLKDAKEHTKPKPGVTNHTWVFIHKEWTKIL